ncbi:sulfotransferase [Longibacter salinarum]|uniref:Sulfotransferase n=1 Tax=Longibacter salinarum TaxID=1850348 RepID=A0A2A8CWA4_9BACT|nr:sulfotransferase domain-containing protein [Longibacter salinarum]PEN12985.1 sulfotransferase [Longibacter salinarum]
MNYAYFGHHKCASTWVRTIIEHVLREAGYTYSVVVDPGTPLKHALLTDYESRFERSEMCSYIASKDIDFISCITADVSQADCLMASKDAKGFHVIRDPRDIVVSAYFSHRNSHPVDGLPHLKAHRAKLLSTSFEEGLFMEMDFLKACLQDIDTWDYNRDNILEVRMENLTTDPYGGFVKIFDFLELMAWEDDTRMIDKTKRFLQTAWNRLVSRHSGLSMLRHQTSVSGSMLLGPVYDNRFEKKAGGRTKGESDAQSHYRKGVAGDWINHFNTAHADYFLERFGDILLNTGYETSNDWVAMVDREKRTVPAANVSLT